MPTITHTQTFDLPDERTDHLVAVHAWDFYSTLCDIDADLRQLLKHGGIEKLTAEALAEQIHSVTCDALARVEG